MKNFIDLHHQIIETHGVIGNTPVFGTDIRGSSPCGSTFSYNTLIISVLLLYRL